MTIPTPSNGLTLAHVVERVVEYIHLTSQHRDDGERVPMHACQQDPCITWHRWLIESRWIG